MALFDRVMVVDWSAAGRPVRGANAIWLGCDDGATANPATRAAAHALLDRWLRAQRRAGRRVLLGIDVALGHPQGLARAVTGQDRALALWEDLAARHRDDAANRSNYRDLAARMNRLLGRPVFWGDGRRQGLADLPRLKPQPHPAMPALRGTDHPPGPGHARPKSPFQLAGAGAVGAQSLTALPWLQRLRADHPGLAVWPFQPVAEALVVLAEVYPSMLGPLGPCPISQRGVDCLDQRQVIGLARVLATLDRQGLLGAMLRPDPRLGHLAAEGQILGFGHEALLRATAQATAQPGGGAVD